MKLLHYNVYVGQGCKVDPTESKLARIGTWLKAQVSGFRWEAERLSPPTRARMCQNSIITAVLRRGVGVTQAADVVGLTECNNWDKLPLAALAASWGYPHTELLVTQSGYHLVLLAKLPIQRFGTQTLTLGPLHAPRRLLPLGEW
jgi:hypothetical protein